MPSLRAFPRHFRLVSCSNYQKTESALRCFAVAAMAKLAKVAVAIQIGFGCRRPSAEEILAIDSGKGEMIDLMDIHQQPVIVFAKSVFANRRNLRLEVGSKMLLVGENRWIGFEELRSPPFEGPYYSLDRCLLGIVNV